MSQVQLLGIHELKCETDMYNRAVNCVARMLTTQWPMKMEHRVDMLNESSPDFPQHLILLEPSDITATSTDQDIVYQDKSFNIIGHCRLIRVIAGNIQQQQNPEKAIIIESVIIDQRLRGKGYGQVLMKLAFDHIRSTAVSTDACPLSNYVYLSTHDQVAFYSKCGFEECPPDQLPSSTKSIVSSNLSVTGVNNLLTMLENRMNKIQSTTPSTSNNTKPTIREVWMRSKLV